MANLFLEAESFAERGGWVIDCASMHKMGSAYLMAHGASVPVADAVTEINLDIIPKHLRHKDYQHLGDMVVTEEMKQIIIDTVDYTMNNLWSVPTGD